MALSTPPQPFQPVIMGNDLGAYALARSFHETYGTHCLVVANSQRGPILDSSILTPHYAGTGAGYDQVARTLVDLARQQPKGLPLLLVVTAEHELDIVEEHWDELSQYYLLPYARPEVMRRTRNKEAFGQVCQELGLPYPKGVELAASADATGEVPLTFPVVVKPADSGRWTQLHFDGKFKVYLIHTPQELGATLRRIAAAGYTGDLLVQEAIPGDDTQGRTVTIYADRSGKVTMAASGQLLLGLHSPEMVGNSAVILTQPQPDLVAQVERIVAATGYHGFANFDIKVDPRDGVARFLDMNTRVGRPNHYVTVAGMSAAQAVVEDYLGGTPATVQQHRNVGVFSYIPKWWAMRYVTDPALKRRVSHAWDRRIAHPLVYQADANSKRWLYRQLADANLVRRFAQDYPRPTEFGL